MLLHFRRTLAEKMFAIRAKVEACKTADGEIDGSRELIGRQFLGIVIGRNWTVVRSREDHCDLSGCDRRRKTRTRQQ